MRSVTRNWRNGNKIFMEPAEDAVNEAYLKHDIETEEDADKFEEWAETYTNTIGDLGRLGKSSLVDAISQMHSYFEAQRKKLSGDYEVEGEKKEDTSRPRMDKARGCDFRKTRANCEEVADRIAAHYGLEDGIKRT